MTDTDRNEGATRLEARAKQLLDASVAGLDASTRSKLARARARALERGASGGIRARLPGMRGWAPAGVAAAAVATVVLVWRGSETPEPPLEAFGSADLEIVLGDDDFEMLEELEFYSWLEEQPELELPEPTDDGIG